MRKGHRTFGLHHDTAMVFRFNVRFGVQKAVEGLLEDSSSSSISECKSRRVTCSENPKGNPKGMR